MSHYDKERREAENNALSAVKPLSKYERKLRSEVIDVYDVLKAFNVTCPAMQHAIKKMLCTGLRGHKDFQTDAKEAIKSIERAMELNNETTI